MTFLSSNGSHKRVFLLQKSLIFNIFKRNKNNPSKSINGSWRERQSAAFPALKSYLYYAYLKNV